MDPTTAVATAAASPEIFTTSNLIALGVSLLAGRGMKAIGQRYEKAGGPPIQKVLAPLASIAVAVGASAATHGQVGIEQVLAQGGAVGVLASGLHGIGKNAVEFAKIIFGKRPK